MGQEGGGWIPPKSVPNRKGARFARRRWMGADGDGGSKGRGSERTQNHTRDGMLTSFDEDSEEAVEGPDFWVKMSHTYQAREVQEPDFVFNKLGKRRRRNGRNGSQRKGSEPTPTDSRFETLMTGKKNLIPAQNMGAAGCGGGLEGTGERAHPSRCPARRGHNRKDTKPQVQMVNL